MTQLTTLQPVEGTRKRKRVGRGTGNGRGRTCGRGDKGQNSRKSGGVRPGFEGGQTPLLKRIPKLKGFRNINRKEYQVVNVDKLSAFEGKTVDRDALIAAGLVLKDALHIKILGNGEITGKVTIKGLKVSKTAEEKVVKAGGAVEDVPKEEKVVSEKKKKK